MSQVGFFSANYLVSVVSGLAGAYLLHKANPEANKAVTFFLLPLLIAFVMIKVMNAIFPNINEKVNDVRNYLEDKTVGQVNDMGYFEIYPILFVTFLIFVILLYTGRLG